MDILLARREINKKPQKIKVDKLKEEMKNCNDKIFYFDKENSHKDIMGLIETFENDNYTVHFKEIKFGLEEDAYMYKLHIL
jgi:hypothetical protein